MSIAEFLTWYLKIMSPLVSFFLPFMIIIRSVGLLLWRYWNISKNGHVRFAICITPSSRYREKAISHGSQDSFLEWLKSRGRRCRRPAPLKCCIYYKVEPVLVLGKPRPTKGRPARAPLRSDKGKNSVRGWRRPRSAALYALFHHRFFSFHNEKISKVFVHQKKIGTREKNKSLYIKKHFQKSSSKRRKREAEIVKEIKKKQMFGCR